MSRISDAAEDLAAVLKVGARVLDQIEQRGRRLSRLSSAALHAIIGISASYLIAYGAAFAVDVNVLIAGSLGAGILGPVGVLVSRRTRSGNNAAEGFETKLDQAQQLVEFLQENGASLPKSTQQQIHDHIGRVLTADQAPQVALPPPTPATVPLLRSPDQPAQ